MSDGREMFLDYAWTELESYSTKYQCSESSRRQEQSIIYIIVLHITTYFNTGVTFKNASN